MSFFEMALKLLRLLIFVGLPISNLKIVPHFMCICVTFKKLAKKRIQVEAILTKCVSGFSFLCTSDDVDMVYSSNHYASFIQPSMNFIHVVYHTNTASNNNISYTGFLMQCNNNMLRRYASYFSKLP